MNSNKNKDEKNPIIDEVLNEDIPEDEKLPDDLEHVEDNVPEDDHELEDETEEESEEDETPEEKEEVKPHVETDEDKEKRYRAQQSEAQIQIERNKQFVNKVDEAANLPDPTEEELIKEFPEWDAMTETEKRLAKRSFINEKRFNLINQGAQESKKIDEWAEKVDEFIDSTDGKPEFTSLSGHEMEFRKYSMQGSHRGVDINILLGAFLHSLPITPVKRGSLFNKGGGGERQETRNPNGVITDSDEAANLRKTNPREYARKVKTGKIKLEV